jgi:hypothetical protein
MLAVVIVKLPLLGEVSKSERLSFEPDSEDKLEIALQSEKQSLERSFTEAGRERD